MTKLELIMPRKIKQYKPIPSSGGKRKKEKGKKKKEKRDY